MREDHRELCQPDPNVPAAPGSSFGAHFLSASETKSFCSTDLKLWRCLLHRLDLIQLKFCVNLSKILEVIWFLVMTVFFVSPCNRILKSSNRFYFGAVCNGATLFTCLLPIFEGFNGVSLLFDIAPKCEVMWSFFIKSSTKISTIINWSKHAFILAERSIFFVALYTWWKSTASSEKY